jgi:acetyl-CoA carboxylase biotin carboxyl carrier protein
LDLKELKEILQILDDKEVTDFELEEQGMKLRIRKAASGSPNHVGPPTVVTQLMPAAAPAGTPPAAPAQPGPAEGPAAALEEPVGVSVVKSPIVGTFYRASDPNASPFVSVGDHVRVGQVLCIIEAMKLMNEIEAEVAGEVLKIHSENGQPVQYGEPLFSIRTEP